MDTRSDHARTITSELFSTTPILRWIANSFIVCGVATLGALITSSMAGYAFARGNFVGKNVLFVLFLGILMVPLEARIVPLFIVLAKLNLVNTYAALIGPSFRLHFWHLHAAPVLSGHSARL